MIGSSSDDETISIYSEDFFKLPPHSPSDEKEEEEETLSKSEYTLPIPFARKALTYFNAKEQTDFDLVLDQPTDFGMIFLPEPILHVNFFARSSASGLPSLFYAELEVTCLTSTNESDITVFGCSMLRLVDSGNPLGFQCDSCESETVIHPGPLRGYGVQKGDLFENSIFWKYRSCLSLDSYYFNQNFAIHEKLYTACAKKAVQHLNSTVIQLSRQFKEGANISQVTRVDTSLKSVCNWELVDVVAAMDRGGDPIHVNFTVESSDMVGSPMLCFAELFLPEGLIYKAWTTEKEQFLEVRGCCILKKHKYETQFARVCGVCLDRLIHPGPAYGHCSLIGDEFDGRDFKLVGCGIF